MYGAGRRVKGVVFRVQGLKVQVESSGLRGYEDVLGGEKLLEGLGFRGFAAAVGVHLG